MKKKSKTSVEQYMHVTSPKWKQFWILMDEDNGHAKYRTYFWVFGTKKEATKHRSKQHKMKFGARLSQPIKVSTIF